MELILKTNASLVLWRPGLGEMGWYNEAFLSSSSTKNKCEL